MSAAFLPGRGGSVRVLLVAVAFVTSAVGCTSSGGGAAASCVHRVKYDERTYRDLANVDFKIANKLGAVSSVRCNDTGHQDDAEEATTESAAYAVEGFDTDIAIAVGDSPGDAVFFAVDSGKGLPPEVEKRIEGSS